MRARPLVKYLDLPRRSRHPQNTHNPRDCGVQVLRCARQSIDKLFFFHVQCSHCRNLKVKFFNTPSP